MISFPGQWLRIQSTSFQVTAGSNCEPIHSESVLSPVPLPSRTVRLPNERRFAVNTPNAHAGLLAMSNALLNVSRGGMLRPLCASRRRMPWT